MPEQVEQILMFSGEVVLFKRKNNKKGIWSCRVKDKDGTYLIKSTKTADLDHARHFAGNFYHNTRALIEHNIAIRTPNVAKAYEIWVKEYWNNKPEISEKQRKRKTNRLETIRWQFQKYLLKYFGNTNITAINTNSIAEYCIWRAGYYKREENKEEITNFTAITPSEVSIKLEIVALRALLNYALIKGWIKSIPVVSIPKQLPVNRARARSGITGDEVDLLVLHKENKYSINGEKRKLTTNQKRQRDLIVLMVQFIRYTGLRAGELLDLKWTDISVAKNEDGIDFIKINVVDGKTGSRTAVAQSALSFILVELHRITGSGNGYVFCEVEKGTRLTHPSKTLQVMLEEIGVERKIVLYDARHLFITESIINNTDLYTIALNCGTSIHHIEKTYSKVLAIQRVDKLARFKNLGKMVSAESAVKVVSILKDAGIVRVE